jgi:hypothetical protein
MRRTSERCLCILSSVRLIIPSYFVNLVLSGRIKPVRAYSFNFNLRYAQSQAKHQTEVHAIVVNTKHYIHNYYPIITTNS